ncbi:hypothetical protein [Mahella sp.]|uniref:hypothetical protein n=1 Tax=Mahella sp. TaxID=2798721 RepID=UPI0025B92201|nr:hypothetical protein [Mahella sp.]MBZ4665395.1 carboxypeptidase [Mahella sp.]
MGKYRNKGIALILVLLMVLSFMSIGQDNVARAVDDDSKKVIINEFGQGTSGKNFEWVELLVVQDVDMRKWDLGDTTPGVLSFSDDAFWSDVKAGTIIVIDNNVDGKTRVTILGGTGVLGSSIEDYAMTKLDAAK